MKNGIRDIELLAPAKNAEIGIEAIRHGADAVYMGAAHHGARASAGNSIADIARVVDYAHRFHAKVYVTVNTLVYDNELSDVEQLVRELYKIGVDAIIVQDLALLRLDIPPIALHASTQCDIRSVEKAKFYESLGFSQLVLPREFTREEIMAVAGSVNVPIESFVHGALCVCYSGRCQLSQYVKGRSANRGECAQMCRLAYDLEDEKGNKMLRNKHLLSLRDLNMSRQLREMIDAGVSSFKIEGRLKDIDYVKNVVAYYSRAIDRVISEMPECRRASQGAVRLDFVPDLQKSFNRSFTTYFFDERKPQRASMASIQTPKSIGEPIGKFTAVKGKTSVISTSATIANGDGLSFFNAEKDFCGCRVNKVEGKTVFFRETLNVVPGTQVFRTFDKQFSDALNRSSAERRIAVDATLHYLNNRIYLTLTDEYNNSVTCCSAPIALEEANTAQSERQMGVLAKMGDSIFEMRNAQVLGQLFIPSSLLTSLRRDTVDALTSLRLTTHPRSYRKDEDRGVLYPFKHLISSDNVANHLADEVYREHGVESIEPAIEITGKSENGVLMNTRYCLRRELGACRLEANGKSLPDKLFLRNGNTRLEVVCDCAACEMKIKIASK